MYMASRAMIIEKKADSAIPSPLSLPTADTLPEGPPPASNVTRTSLSTTPSSPWKIPAQGDHSCASFSSILNEECEAAKSQKNMNIKSSRNSTASSYSASSNSLKHLAGFYFQASGSRKREPSREPSQSDSGSDDSSYLLPLGSGDSMEELQQGHAEHSMHGIGEEVDHDDRDDHDHDHDDDDYEDEDEDDKGAHASRLFDEKKDLPSQLKNLTGPNISATEGIHILSSSLGGQKSIKKSKEPLPDWRMRRLKKERFVYANFRFIVRDDSESFREYVPLSQAKVGKSERYLDAVSHPDIYPPWSDVIAVIQNVTVPLAVEQGEAHLQLLEPQEPSFPSCPICLSERMICPRLTPCGHAFCWPCLLHHLAQGEVKWRHCPICFETFTKKELKILIFDHVSTSFESVDLTSNAVVFQRMRRLPGVILYSHEDGGEASECTIPSKTSRSLLHTFDIEPSDVELSTSDFHYSGSSALTRTLSDSFDFSKYFLATSLWTVRTLLEPEMSLLLKEFHSSISCEDWSTAPFLEMAMEEIRMFIGREEEQILKTTLEASATGSTAILLASPLPQKQRLEGEAVDPLGPLFQESSVFYQIADGRPIFIHPFLENGREDSLHAAQFELRVDSVHEFTMTREIRRKFSKHLLHLPLGCKFYTCMSSTRLKAE